MFERGKISLKELEGISSSKTTEEDRVKDKPKHRVKSKVVWGEKPHALGEKPQDKPVNITTSNDAIMDDFDIVETDEVLLIDTTVEIGKTNYPSMSKNNEIKEAIHEALLMKDSVDKLLLRVDVIPAECRTMIEKTPLLPQRKLIRPGGPVEAQSSKVENVRSNKPILQNVIIEAETIETEEKPMTPLNSDKPQVTVNKDMMTFEDDTLPVLQTTPRTLKSLSEKEQAEVRKTIEIERKRAKEAMDAAEEARKKAETLRKELQEAENKVRDADNKVRKLQDTVTVDADKFTTDEVIMIGGKRFSVNMVQGNKLRLQPIDRIDDFRTIISEGEILQIKTKRLKVTEVTAQGMRLIPVK